MDGLCGMLQDDHQAALNGPAISIETGNRALRFTSAPATDRLPRQMPGQDGAGPGRGGPRAGRVPGAFSRPSPDNDLPRRMNTALLLCVLVDSGSRTGASHATP